MRPPACAAVIRLDALGDSLLSRPAVEALAAAWPATRIVVAASRIGAAAFRGVAEPVADLRGAAPEVALVFTEKRAGLELARRSGAKVRVGFDPGWTQPIRSLWLRAALTHRVPWPNRLETDPGLHEIERYFLLLAQVGVPAPQDPPALQLDLREEERRFARARLGARFEAPPYALQWLPRWTALGWPERLPERVLTGLPEPRLVFYAPADEAQAAPWAARLGATGCCLPDLHRYAAVMEGCRLLVTPDTGAAHVAAAVGTPVVDLFPARHAAHCTRRWRPWRVPHRLVLRGDYAPGREEALAGELVRRALELCPP